MLSIIKKSPKCCNHVPKQIINCNLNFNLVRHIMKIRIGIVVEKLISVVCLVIVEIWFNTLLKGFGEGLAVIEPL